ncbi:N-acyl-L-homoserine lactone (AHL) synthase [Fulvimarina endophytica]|uniref:Acyl-homoserine-lactone synthase n=1 Tax=Fulvimarina endophytica TaxID=2293836 RepID=A0A371X2D3_9HYPH|nr:acyl-homoserine-lactone synthase [Fulvimarina endophytica]RFC63369.1 N-acyl-L-homoserine lactone (AHL) synthase [Fulvimarina endophytica]
MSFLLVQADSFERHSGLLDEMFRLRARVFHEQLQWDVTVEDMKEIDRYDRMNPAYLLWTNEDRSVLYGSARLMPTTGPTLLYDVFAETFPDGATLSAPGIWEATRLCIDEARIAEDHPDLAPNKALCRMFLASCEVALAHGIDTIVGNLDPLVLRIYRQHGAAIDEVGRSDAFGRRPVCCGVFAVTETVCGTMRDRLRLDAPLYRGTEPGRARQRPRLVAGTNWRVKALRGKAAS